MVQWLRLGPGTDAVEHCQKKNAEIITKLLLFIINSCILPQKSSFIANSGRIESQNLCFGLLFFIYKEFVIRQITISANLNSCISQLSSLLSHVQLFVTPRTPGCQASLSITNSWSLLKLKSIKPMMPYNNLILLLTPPPLASS